jgi:hypothetical protein
VGKPQELGRTAEKNVAKILRFYGRTVCVQRHKSPFDLLVDGFRAEVKCAEMRMVEDAPSWTFNIHRHGVVSEQTDFYIFRLEHVPFSKYPIHLLYRAPLNTHVACVSFRSLLSRDAIAVVDFYRFARGELSRTTPMAA